MFPHTGTVWWELVWVFHPDQRESLRASLLFLRSHDMWGFTVHGAPQADVREAQHMEQRGTHKNNTGITSAATQQTKTLGHICTCLPDFLQNQGDFVVCLVVWLTLYFHTSPKNTAVNSWITFQKYILGNRHCVNLSLNKNHYTQKPCTPRPMYYYSICSEHSK